MAGVIMPLQNIALRPLQAAWKTGPESRRSIGETTFTPRQGEENSKGRVADHSPGTPSVLRNTDGTSIRFFPDLPYAPEDQRPAASAPITGHGCPKCCATMLPVEDDFRELDAALIS